MATILRKLRVDFGSLVDEPANQDARVLLFKRGEMQKADMMQNQIPCPMCGQPMEKGGVCKACGYDMSKAKADKQKRHRAIALVAKSEEAAMSFREILAEDDQEQMIETYVDALHESIGSILEDPMVEDKPAAVRASVAEFVADLMAGVTKRVSKIGAKMSGDRLTKLQAALETLMAIMREVSGGTMEGTGMSKQEVAVAAEAPADAGAADDVTKRLADLEKRAHEAEARAEQLEKAAQEAASVAKAEKDARLTSEWIAKVAGDEFRGLTVDAPAFGAVMKRASETLAADDLTEIERVLKSAAAQIRTNDKLTQEIGKVGAEASDSATASITGLAEELQKSGVAKNFAEAVSVLSANPEHKQLFKRYLAEQRGR